MPGAAPSTLTRPDRSPHRVATAVFLLYIFLLMSRGVEMLSVFLGANLHFTMILMIASLLAAVVTGGLLQAVRTPVVFLLTPLNFLPSHVHFLFLHISKFNDCFNFILRTHAFAAVHSNIF